MEAKKLEWDEKYSVGVKIIDDQHKQMFETINLLIEMMKNIPKKEELDEVVQRLIQYKAYHFSTEEKYFREFNYEDREEHEGKHREFNIRLQEIIRESNGDSLTLAYTLVDFLEDWLISHLMTADQKYIKCFHDHGLK